jgi:hypothetical protein
LDIIIGFLHLTPFVPARNKVVSSSSDGGIFYLDKKEFDKYEEKDRAGRYWYHRTPNELFYSGMFLILWCSS